MSQPAALPLAYALVMAAACLSVLWLLHREPMASGLDRADRRVILLAAFTGSMVGARFPYWIMRLDDLSLATLFADSGKTILGGLVGGYFAVELAKWALGVRTKTGDTFAAPVALGIAIGRLGCFVGRCCYGTPTALPWGVDFGDGVSRHPTQLYELVFHLAAAGVLIRWRSRGRYPRQLMKAYILAYLAYRFVTELVRPEAVVGMGLTAYQLAAALLMPVFLALWWMDHEPRHPSGLEA